MEQSDRNKIQHNIVALSALTNLENLVDILINSGVIDLEFFYRIKSEYMHTRERNQEFFLRYTKRGPEAFRILVESLREAGHFSEANRLESSERNRISVSSLESPSESEATNSTSSSNGSVGNRFALELLESPENSSSASSISTNALMQPGRGAGSFDPATVHWGNRIEPISTESPPAEQLGELTMGDLPPLEIVVKRTSNYNQGKTNTDEAYPMMSKPRGFALIINNIDFTGDPSAKRRGAEVDSENLDNLLQGLGFTTTVLRNVKKDDLLNPDTGILAKFIEQFHNKPVDACVVAIMSHGTEELVRSSDPEKVDDPRYSYWHLQEDITQRFNNRHCPILIDKPKIFIVQACRGDTRDRGVRRTQTDGKIQVAEMPKFPPNYELSRPTNEDILICYSTVPGFVSNRDTERGTWYIQCLCETFMENAHNTEISAMLRKVSKRMSLISSEFGEKQMCSFNNIGFHRELYFNPGLFATETVAETNGSGSIPLP